MASPVPILLVGDQPDNLLALETLLGEPRLTVVRTPSSEEALRLLPLEDFAVVVLDVPLGRDALPIVRAIRAQERSRRTPLLFLTAPEGDSTLPPETYALGAVDHLVKPLVPEALRGKVALFVELFQNVHLRHSESRLRALLENAWDGISLVAPDGTILDNIPDNLHRLGYSREEFVGHGGFLFVHPDDLPAMQAAMSRLLTAPAAKATLQYRLRRKDGSWCWVEGIGTNLLHEPSVQAIVVNYRDIGPQKGLEEELRRRAEALAEADRQKDQFLSMLAHELRNPLAPLLNGLHILRQSQSPPAVQERTRGMMERQLRHLVRLVDDLLDVARILRGKIPLRKERLDLGRLVRAAAEDRRPILQHAGPALLLDVPETPVWVTGDATRLTQILNNLLDNSAKFAGGGCRVTVRVRADAQRRQALLTVRDEGIGIDREVLSNLFGLFCQADRGLDRSRGGLGLGLAIVKGLAELHGGGVEAFSEGPGRGAEFVVRLPLEQEPSVLTEKTPDIGTRGSKQRVLIVEDNKDAADSLRMLLELLGHEVRVAYTGPDGVEAARQWCPNVVVCDIGLPGLDGYGVANELRRNPATAQARLVALTGYGRDEDRLRTKEAGFSHHLVKPADPVELSKLLASDGTN